MACLTADSKPWNASYHTHLTPIHVRDEMTTVLTLPGADSLGDMATVQAAFGGPQALLAQLGIYSQANVVGVVYNDYDPVFGYIDAANKLNTALKARPVGEQIVVVGHSYGAVGICEWLRLYGTSTKISPSQITFVLAANSIRPNNGLGTMLGLYGPGSGPVTTRFKVFDAARQFDYWADYPNVLTSTSYWQAVGNCSAGDEVTGEVNGVPNNIHNSYQNVRLDDVNAAKAVVGTVTFLLCETDPPPSASGLTRTQIETAYNRVVSTGGW